ncbi:hypothetical protein [Phage f2b1]|nr:hypothetical protein [Phage f2b1]
MAIVDVTEYMLVPFEQYKTLDEKLQALLNGETLFIKQFERNEQSDVLVRVVQKKFTVSQISYDVYVNELAERYWVTFNIGFNDISLFTCFKFVEGAFNLDNKYMINDKVEYLSIDGNYDAAVILEVYQHVTDPSKFAYRLSRDGALYAEEELIQNPYS